MKRKQHSTDLSLSFFLSLEAINSIDKRTDFGNYSCVANNTLGQASRNIEVTLESTVFISLFHSFLASALGVRSTFIAAYSLFAPRRPKGRVRKEALEELLLNHFSS
jgi:hypothetical protein